MPAHSGRRISIGQRFPRAEALAEENLRRVNQSVRDRPSAAAGTTTGTR
jgi:hypothetical protein